MVSDLESCLFGCLVSHCDCPVAHKSKFPKFFLVSGGEDRVDGSQHGPLSSKLFIKIGNIGRVCLSLVRLVDENSKKDGLIKGRTI